MKKTKDTTTNDLLLALLKQNGYTPMVFDEGLYAITFMGEDIVLHVHEERHSVTLQDMYWCFIDENDRKGLLNAKKMVNILNKLGISKLVVEKDNDKFHVCTLLTISLVNDIPQLDDYLNNQFKDLLFHRGALTDIDYKRIKREPDSVDYKVAPLVYDALQELVCFPEFYPDDEGVFIEFFYESIYVQVRIDNNHPIAKTLYINWYNFPLADFKLFAKVCEIINEINLKQVGTTLSWHIDEQSQEVRISSTDRFYVTENREETVFSIKRIVSGLIKAKILFELMLEDSYEADNQNI